MLEAKRIMAVMSFCSIAITFLSPGNSQADFDSHLKIEIPDSVSFLVSSSDLENFIRSENPIDRIVACQRLGQIKGESAYHLLVEAFNNEPGRPAIEAPRGVKYYALINIAKTEVPEVEDFLKKVSTHLAGQIEIIPQGFVPVDIITALEGAFDGLLDLGTDSAINYLKGIFNNERYYWMIRQLAHMNILRYELKKGDYATASDTTNFLLNLHTKAGSKIALYDSTGNFDVNYILNGSSGFLLFEYRRTTLPYLSDYILQLDADDPMLPLLKQMETDMINNPPRNLE